MPVKGRDSKTLEISPLDRLSQFFHTFRGIEGEFMVILLISLAFEIHFSKG